MDSLNFKFDGITYSVREINGDTLRASRTSNGKRLRGRPRSFDLTEVQSLLRFRQDGQTHYIREIDGDTVRAGLITRGKRRGGRARTINLQEILQ